MRKVGNQRTLPTLHTKGLDSKASLFLVPTLVRCEPEKNYKDCI
ncbi:hypothetical protein QUF54_06255 [Candidatus Marithioploca araucensis]|uniref:Uncharacterized protein n=1 Tax=Candidatus Marithioploca araucensis TaxID=70273 RepID=A0ABT7VTP2_9GAMM|nr:hypothetical protein [Candidatus Marithioploca araucensis]